MPPSLQALDLFAGPGGWDEGLLDLGVRPLGVEWDDSACLTRAAAGHLTVQGDVSELDPRAVFTGDGSLDLLIGSPPCQAFSAAGKGGGHRDLPLIYEAMDALVDGRDLRAELRPRMEDPRSLLVAEPLRWALALRPRWIALEQVPPVLPIWERMAHDLRRAGWKVWTGLLSAERYGVPQTRQRAFLLADRDRPVRPPEPTHQSYVPPRKEDADLERLFEPGRRERIVRPGEEHLAPWVSMADALGWSGRGEVTVQRGQGMEERHGAREPRPTSEPAPTIRAGSKGSGPNLVVTGEEDRPARTLCGHHTPRWLYDEPNAPAEPGEGIRVLTRGEDGSRPNDVFDATERPSRAVTGRAYSLIAEGIEVEDAPTFVQRERSGDRAEEGFDPDGAPAQALTSKARSWTLRTGDNTMSSSRDVEDMIPYERSVDDPAPTLVAKAGGAWRIAPEGDHPDPPMSFKTRGQPPAEGENGDWSYERPSTTVAGDPRVPQPGHKKDAANPGSPRRMEDAVRLSVPEASILQGFRPDYPWDGLRVPKHVASGGTIEDDDALPDEFVADLAQRGVRFVVRLEGGKDGQVLEAIVRPDAVDVMHDLARLRFGYAAVLRYVGLAAGDEVAPALAERLGGGSALICVERVTVEPPLLPVAGAPASGDSYAFTVLARWLGWAPLEAERAVAVELVVPEAEALCAAQPVASFDCAYAHVSILLDEPKASSRTKQFEQIGNAVPPPLARACVVALLGRPA